APAVDESKIIITVEETPIGGGYDISLAEARKRLADEFDTEGIDAFELREIAEEDRLLREAVEKADAEIARGVVAEAPEAAKVAPEAVAATFTDDLVPRNELDEVLKTRKKANGVYEGAEPVIGPDAPGQTPTAPRVANESRGALKQWMDDVLFPQLEENLNSVPVTAESTVLEADLRQWAIGAKANVTTARAVSVDVASAARTFALHDYGKRFGIDLLLSYIYPYQFWHSRTYAKWIKRIANDPFLFSAYSTYRKTMEKAHAGLPDWWKFNINTNELLGIDSDNPLYFNLEASISPLNGLTNVDFNDKYKRVDSVSSTLDDLNKFGSSTWTIY
ncbi:hypothetical protein LCGC14_3167220, partial [marine sediment metagenome]